MIYMQVGSAKSMKFGYMSTIYNKTFRKLFTLASEIKA